MAAIESPEKVGLRPFHEFDEAIQTWPRGQWPVLPTFFYGGIEYGTIKRPASGNGRPG